MEKVKWSDLPQEIQDRNVVNWSEIPKNLDLKTLPSGVTIMPVTGEARKRAVREYKELQARIAAKMGPLTEEEISDIANGRS